MLTVFNNAHSKPILKNLKLCLNEHGRNHIFSFKNSPSSQTEALELYDYSYEVLGTNTKVIALSHL